MSLKSRFRGIRGDLSQGAFAALLGIKQPSVSEIETGETKNLKAGTLLAVARYGKVDPEWLYTGMGDKSRTRPSPEEMEAVAIFRGLKEDPRLLAAWMASGRAWLKELPPSASEPFPQVMRPVEKRKPHKALYSVSKEPK